MGRGGGGRIKEKERRKKNQRKKNQMNQRSLRRSAVLKQFATISRRKTDKNIFLSASGKTQPEKSLYIKVSH